NGVAKEFPLILTTGRLNEHDSGETHGSPWLAELQQVMHVEMHPMDAEALGIALGQDVWVESPTGGRIKVEAMINEQGLRGTVFLPQHFAGRFQGFDLRPRYPAGSEPVVTGETANTVTGYGYDPITQIQSSKASLCRVVRA